MAQLVKGLLARIRPKTGDIAGKLDFQFNPTSVKRSGSVTWKWGAGPGSVLPVALFGMVGEQTLSLDLLFDAREDYQDALEGLRGVLSAAEALALPAVDRWNAQTNALAVSPDRCCLVLGKRHWFCQITAWDINEEMHNAQYAPVRARVHYTLRMTNTGLQAVQQYFDQLRMYRERYESRANIPPSQPQPPRGGSVGPNPFE